MFTDQREVPGKLGIERDTHISRRNNVADLPALRGMFLTRRLMSVGLLMIDGFRRPSGCQMNTYNLRAAAEKRAGLVMDRITDAQLRLLGLWGICSC